MACFRPLEGFRSPTGGLVFARHKSIGLRMTVPCGQCIGCRLERSRQWAMRCMHEASLHVDNCFITLTYDDEHLPESGSLVKSHFQKFMKRLRRGSDSPIRFFHCGEYGEQFGRPHYHALLFGHDFADKVEVETDKEYPEWVSASLERVWSGGRCFIGSVTFESAAYVARYVVKKVTGSRADDHYLRVDRSTGECFPVEPEYATMSRRPGIGRRWFDKFGAEVYPSDEVIVRGRPMRPPRFYDQILKVEAPEVATRVQKARRDGRRREDESPARLRVREVCASAKLNLYKER